MILQSLLLTTLIFSASIRDAKHSDLADYELMLGGKNKQFFFEVEKERQDGLMYDYQKIKYSIDRANYLTTLSYLNNQEDCMNILDLGIAIKLTYFNLGSGLIRKDWGLFTPQLYIAGNYKYLAFKYLIIEKGDLFYLELEYKHKIKERLYLVPKIKYIDSNNVRSYQAEFSLEWEIK